MGRKEIGVFKMGLFLIRQTREDLRQYLKENIVVGKKYSVKQIGADHGRAREQSNARAGGKYTAVAILPNVVTFKSPSGIIESFTLMDAVNIVQGIPV